MEGTAYLDCGILARGFARVRCGQCGHDFLIAFSCKGRGVCPSCNARRMVATAAHLRVVHGPSLRDDELLLYDPDRPLKQGRLQYVIRPPLGRIA